MDKYEYNLKFDQMKSLCAEESYDSAAEIADTINWNKIKNVNALVKAGEVYEKAERFQDARDILLMAYDRSPIGRMIIYRLAEVAIKMQDFDGAIEYYNEFVKIAPHDNLRYVLQYNMKKAQGASFEELIPILEEFKDQEYTEEWSYELAYLYHKAGLVDKCIDACDELILWFGDGPYVERALELKMLYQPLSKAQEEKYRRFRQEKQGYVTFGELDYENSGEEVREPVTIPPIAVNQEKFNTVNLQEEIVKGMQQIINATEKSAVSDTMDSIKKIVEEIPYLQLPKQEDEQEKNHIETDEEIDGSLKINFQELLEEESDGQISLLVDEQAQIERQITGQITIQDVLEEWDRTRRAAETALQEAEQRKLESAKARALQEAENIMDRLTDAKPKLDAGVTPQELLAEEYMQGATIPIPQVNGLMGDKSVNNAVISEPGIESRDSDIVDANVEEEENKVPDFNTESMEDKVPDLNIESMESKVPDLNIESMESKIPDLNIESMEDKVPDLNIESMESKVPDLNIESMEAEVPNLNMNEAANPILGLNIEPSREFIPKMSIDSVEDTEPNIDIQSTNKFGTDIGIGPVNGEEPNIGTEPVNGEEPNMGIGSVNGAESDLSVGQVNGEEENYSEPVKEESIINPEMSTSDIRKVKSYGDAVLSMLSGKGKSLVEKEEEETAKMIAAGESLVESSPKVIPDAGIFKPKFDAKVSSDTVRIPSINGLNKFEMETTKKMPDKRELERSGLASQKTMVIPEVLMPEDLDVPDPDPNIPVVDSLTDKQKAIFSYFVPVKGMESQLCKALSGITDRLNKKDSAKRGNLIIQGSQGCGKTVLATSMIKVLQLEEGNLTGKIGKIDAVALNSKDIKLMLDKVAGGCLIIEQAGELNRNTAVSLSFLMEHDMNGTLIILEDTSKGIKKALAQDEGFAKKFTERINLPIFSNDELVSFARSYSNELGYKIDELAILALYNRISNIQRLDQATTLAEVKEIVDEAIDREAHGGLKKAISILTAKRYTEDDKIVLTERNFK